MSFNQRFEKIVVIIMFAIIIIFGPYLLDLGQPGGNFEFNYKITKFHITRDYLYLSNDFSRLIKKNSNISYFFRKRLFNQYISIKNSYDDNFYNAIGLFYPISNDFKLLYSLNENNDKLSEKEKAKYLEYKEQYLSELYKVLMEYRERNNSIRNFITSGGWRGSSLYRLPNRITLYPELALLYLHFIGNFTIDEKTYNDFKYIYETFDIVYNQEKTKFSRHYTTLNLRMHKEQFDFYYPQFIRLYTQNNILYSDILYPEINICETSNVCEKYLQIIKEPNQEANTKILKIIDKHQPVKIKEPVIRNYYFKKYN